MRLNALQYLRAVAALAVVFSHATLQYAPYTEVLPYSGAYGVDIFFVISGFIMVWIARDTDRPMRFFVNRIRRVVPLYWFFTLLIGLIMVVMPSAFRNAGFDPGTLLLSMGFIPHWSAGFPDKLWPILAPGWSLNYEMYFYLVFAFALLVRPAWRIPMITSVIISVFLIAAWFGPGTAFGKFFSETIVFEFIFGMLLAVLFKRGMRMPPAFGICMIVLGSSLLLLQLPLTQALATGIPATLVVAGCLFINAPASRLGLLLGDSSYALYLSHILVLGVLRKIIPPILGDSASAAWVFAIISCLICIVAGIVVHLLVDNWLLRHERLAWFRSRKSADSDARATGPAG